MDNISKISEMGWIKRWAGSYTFISCSYWGHQYFESLKKVLNVNFEHTLFIHKKGTVSFYVRSDEFRKLGKYLANIVDKNPELTKEWLNELKENTDILLSIMKQLENKIPSSKEYKEFLLYYDRHLPYHNFMKKTVDFLSVETLNKYLPLFKDARIYSESVYSETEKFFRLLTKTIAQKEKRNADNLTCLIQPELEEYIKNGRLPNEDLLKTRYDQSALYFENNKLKLCFGKDVGKLEDLIIRNQQKNNNVVKGISAFPGKVSGLAKIILNPLDGLEFNKNDILITGMTRPEFLPYIKKSSAIVTDAGGILCHAAIIARELKIPCVVGTETATKIIQDGQKIEVNADKGIVRKL